MPITETKINLNLPNKTFIEQPMTGKTILRECRDS